MSNELALTQEQKSVLFNPEYNGFNIDLRNKIYPPVVNVLSSDKQFSAFGDDAKKLTIGDYGKLFVRTDLNTMADLKDEIEGVVIRIDQGHEIRDPKENKIVGSDGRLLGKDEKSAIEAKGLKPINMIKILIALDNAANVAKKMDLLKEKMLKGEATKSDFPFAVVTIKGSSWGNWFTVVDKMDEISRKALNKPFREVASTLFKFKIKSVKETGSFGDYYSLDIEPTLNSVEEATAFAPYLLEMKEIGLFYKVADRIKSEDERKIDDVFADMEAPKPVETAKVFDPSVKEAWESDDTLS